MGTGEKKCPSYPKESWRMGTGEKKCLSYPKESWRMGMGKKKKQKWQYNENALRICKKEAANLENVKKCFQGKREKRSKSE